MGIHDREYYRKDPNAARQLLTWTETAVGVLIALNAACFIAQLAGGEAVTGFLAASPGEVFGGHVWKLVTANFAHSPNSAWHILGNMAFLFFLGREVEQIYGRRDFFILYLGAGVLAVLAEVTMLQLRGESGHVLGASGAVMAVVFLCALFYPKKTILFMFLIPAPLWLCCVLFVVMDLSNLFREDAGRFRVANFAHLTGALVGVLYRAFDLRWSNVSNILFRSRGRRPRARGKIIQMPAAQRAPPLRAQSDPVYQRVDDLLAKISSSGMDSLTGEELEFLRDNSARFRRHP